MRFLLINQCFYPDVIATAQYLTDVALDLRARGHQVTVLTGQRGYDDPGRIFAARETWQGVEIRRIYSSGFGRRAKWRRFADFVTFWIACLLRLLAMPHHDVVVSLTSPPLIGVAAALHARFTRARFVLWVMDLNPDEALAAGWLRPGSWTARALGRLARFSFRSADRLIALDRFMKDRLIAHGADADRVSIVPPWSQDEDVFFDPAGRQRFRDQHGATAKCLVMYSGNHSPCHPMDTVLEAAARLSEDARFAFFFIGGGAEFAKVQRYAAERSLSNISCLPYQPREELSASLSAADLHLVVMGDQFVGIKHPCKIYNILGIGAPFLFIGPAVSHVLDLAELGAVDGFFAQHGEVERVVAHLREVADGAPVPAPTPRANHLPPRLSKRAILQGLAAILLDWPSTHPDSSQGHVRPYPPATD